jgi:8-amino-7-oxononanoate synthase
MSLFDKLRPVAERVAALGDGPLPFSTEIEEVCSATEVIVAGRRTLLCGSNNYLGLSFHPEVIAAAQAAVAHDGAGTTGSRAANGTFAAHRRLERSFARLYHKPHAMVFTTGYQANLGVIAGLCGPDDAIILDLESHASIYDGARLSGANLFQFRHNSPADLERKLRKLSDPTRCLVVVEGLYSISGDVAPLADIVRICRETGAFLLVDEAHSFGAYGAHGLGVAEADGVLDQVDFVVGTFSKTLAGVGGYCVSSHEELQYLQYAARPYVFTASGSPANIAGVEAALRIMQAEPQLRDRLWDNVRRVRKGLVDAGFMIGPTESPIVPIVVGTAEHAVAMWKQLLEAGVYTNIVLPPACRPDACLLRTSYSAAHTPAQIDRALAVFEEVGRSLHIIGAPA